MNILNNYIWYGFSTMLISDPRNANILFTGLHDIRKIGGSVLFTIPGKGVQILYDLVASIVVKVSREYAGRLMGLAGNFNGKKSDDFQLQSSFEAKSVYTFAANWKTDKSCVGYVPAAYSRSECGK